MSEADRVQLLLIRGVIAEQPEDDQRKIHETARRLKEVIAECGEHGQIALALVGAEMSI